MLCKRTKKIARNNKKQLWEDRDSYRALVADDSRRIANEQLKFVCTHVTPGGPLMDDNGQGNTMVA
jgi:hypothetical protein